MSYCRTPFSLLTTTSPSRTWLAALRGSGTPPAIPTMRMYSTNGKLRIRFVTATDETLLPILASEVSNTWWDGPFARLGRVPHQYWLPSSAEGGLTGVGSSRINRHAASSLGSAVQMAKHGCNVLESALSGVVIPVRFRRIFDSDPKMRRVTPVTGNQDHPLRRGMSADQKVGEHP